MENKGYKDFFCFIKITMYLFNVLMFLSLKTTIILLLCIEMVRCKTCFFSRKHWFFKIVMISYNNLWLIPSEYLRHQNENYVFMIRRNWSFYDQNLQFAGILMFKIFIFIFFNFNFSLLQNIFEGNIPLGCYFPRKPSLLNSFKCLKSFNGPKN